jgi:hypothetical protein
MAFDPVTHCAQFVVSDGGVHHPTDESNRAECGGSWALTGGGQNGFNALQLYQVTGQILAGSWFPGLFGSPPTFVPGHTDLYIGTQDNQLWASPNGGASWPIPTGNEGNAIQVPRYGRTLLGGSFQDGSTVTWLQFFDGVHRSLPHFTSVRNWNNPPVPNYGPPIVITRSVYAQLGVYQFESAPPDYLLFLTRDTGASWGPLGDWRDFVAVFPRAPYGGTFQVSIIGDDVTLFYAVDKGGALRLEKLQGIKKDGRLVGPRRLIFPADVNGFDSMDWRAVFAVDPNDPSHLLAADKGAGQMKFSIDGGVTWAVDSELTDLATQHGELPFANQYQTQVNAIAFDPVYRNHILVGTEDAGVFRSIDGGASWSAIPYSSRASGISSFFFIESNSREPNDTVIVSTFGRGLWKLIIPPASRGGSGAALNNAGPSLSNGPFLVPDAQQAPFATWVRDAFTGENTPDLFLNWDAYPHLRWLAVSGGDIGDISLDEFGRVLGVAIDAGQIVVSSADGRVVSIDLPVVRTNAAGTFEGCPACTNVVQNQGSIRGLLLEDGTLRAIIAGAGPLPGEAAIAAFAPVITQPPLPPEETGPVGPRLKVFGSRGGQATAIVGDSVTLYGAGFCAGSGCSLVEVKVGEMTVAQGVIIGTNGDFQVSFPAPAWPDLGVFGARVRPSEVRAFQTAANNQTIEARAMLVFSTGGDAEEEEESEPLELESAGTLDGRSIGACFNQAVTRESVENLANYSVNGGATPVLSATLREDGKSVRLLLASQLVGGSFSLLATNILNLSSNAGGGTVVGVVPGDTLTAADLGQPLPTVAVFSCESSSFEIMAGGAGTWGLADQGAFVSRPLTGDFDVWSRVIPVNGPYGIIGGLEARESASDPSARSVELLLLPNLDAPPNYLEVSAFLRAAPGANSQRFGTADSADVPPTPVFRLRRLGQVFTAFLSEDGVTWKVVGRFDTSSNPLSGTLFVGFGAAAARVNQTATVAFRDFRFEQPAAPCIPLTANAVAWWRAEGDANDAIGDRHDLDGTLQGGTSFAAGKVGQAFSFDGADGSYVSVPDRTVWDFGMNDFTIELWAKFNEIKRVMFLHQQSGADAGGFEFDFQAGGVGLVFARNPSAGGIVRPWSPSPVINTWYHLAVTRQSGTYRLYVNGVQMGAEEVDPNPVNNVTGPLRIGSYAGEPGYGVNGLLDEPTIYSRALSAAELLAIVNAGSAGKCQTTDCMSINLSVPACVSTNSVHVTGNMSSCSSVTRLEWTRNDMSHVICENCGVNPNFAFDLPVDGPCFGYTFTVTSYDALGNVTSVTKTIPADQISPTIVCSSNIVVSCAGPSGASATYSVLASDNCDPFPIVTCTPPSGSFFSVGDTLVHCTARDTCGNSNFCDFTVKVTTNCSSTCSTNLLVNGSFEEPGVPDGYVALSGGDSTILGWVTVLNGVEWFNPHVAPLNVNTGTARNGNYLLDLAPSIGLGGGIQQTFATVTGRWYRGSFALGTSKERGRNGTASLTVTVAGAAHAFNITTTSASIAWEAKEFRFVATSSTTTLTFSTMDDPALSFVNLDDVRVTDCPESLAGYGGFSYTVLGGASASVLSNQLVLSNFGTQGVAGARLDVSGMHSASLTLGELDPSALPEGASFTISAFGEVNGHADALISSLRAVRVGSEIQCSADYTSIGALYCTFLIYDGANLVAQAFDQAGMSARVIGSTECSRWNPYSADPVSAHPSSVVELLTRPLIAIAGGQPVAGTRLVIQPQPNRISNPPNPIVTPTYTIGWPKWLPWYQISPFVNPPWRIPGDPSPFDTPALHQVIIGSLTRFEVTGQGAGTLRILEQRAGMFGHEHKAVGDVSLSGAGTSLHVDNPASALAGVDILAGGSDSWDNRSGVEFDARWLALTPQPDPPGFPTPPIGALLQATLTGSVDEGANQLLATIQALKSGSNSITIQGNFPPLGVPGQTMEIWNGSSLVYTAKPPPWPPNAIVGSWPERFDGAISPPCSGPGCTGPDPWISFSWASSVTFTLPGLTNPPVIGDRIRFIASDPIPRPALKLDRISLLLGGGLGGLQLISEHFGPAGPSFSGLSHQPIGLASLTTTSNEFVVTNFGTSNDYGASVMLGSSPFADVSVIGPDLASPSGSELRLKTYGEFNGVRDQLIGSLIATKAGTNLEFTANLGPDNLNSEPQVTVHVYDGLNIVSSSLVTSNIVVKVPSILRDAWEARGWWMFRPGAYRTHIDFPNRRLITLSGQAPVFGTHVEFQACWTCGNPSPQPSLRDAPSLSRVDLVAHGLPRFIISRERLGLLAQAHEATGLARVLGIGKELHVRNLIGGSANPDGIAFPLDPRKTNNVSVYFRPVDLFGQMPTGMVLSVTGSGVLTGAVDHVLGGSTITKLALLKKIFADYSPVFAQSRRVEVLSNNIVVLTTSLPGATGEVATVDDWPIGCGKATVGPLGPVLCFWWRYWPQAQFLINNQSVVGDEIRILAENVPWPLTLSQFELRASGLDELVLTGDAAEQTGPIRTTAQRFGDILAISWTPLNLRQALQSADNVTGPWTDVPGVTVPPFIASPTGSNTFFRVRPGSF